MTQKHTPLDEWSVCRRYLYLTKYNIRNTQTYLHQKRFESTIPASFRPQTCVLDLVATGTGSCGLLNKFNKLTGKSVD